MARALRAPEKSNSFGQRQTARLTGREQHPPVLLQFITARGGKASSGHVKRSGSIRVIPRRRLTWSRLYTATASAEAADETLRPLTTAHQQSPTASRDTDQAGRWSTNYTNYPHHSAAARQGVSAEEPFGKFV